MFNRLPFAAPTGRGKLVVGEQPDDKKNKTGVKLTAVVFFDGTLNNRANTRLRLTTQEQLTQVEQRTRLAREQAAADAKGAAARLRTAVGEAQRAEAEPAAVAAEQELAKLTREHEEAEKALTAYKSKIDGKSGANFYSNVSILGEMTIIEDKAKGVSQYIEGIGTTDGGGDDMHGSAFGAGFSGIIAKVNKGVRELSSKLGKLYDIEKEYIEDLTIDVFGFSRGAAAARHFVARKHLSLIGANNICQSLKITDYTAVKFRFVGLFDSVSSYNPGPVDVHREFKGPARVLNHAANAADIAANLGPAGVAMKINPDVDPAFANDVAELHLRIEEKATKVVQFAAGDEYRRNFPSTTISSARSLHIGVELVLPGAHSDIGGGYGEADDEPREMLLDELRRLVTEGWYAPADDEFGAPLAGYNPTVRRVRRALPNDYQYVPLALMLELAHGNGMKFQDFTEDKFKAYTVSVPLRAVYQQLRAQVTAHAGGTAERTLVALPPADWAWLRRYYLHRSHHGIAMAPRLVGEKPHQLPERFLIEG